MRTELTPFERDAMTTLFTGDHPVLEALREQLAVCEVSKRDFTGVGFFTWLALPADVSPVPLNRERLILGDVAATMDGVAHGIGLILFVERGLLDNLEGFTYDEPWPDRIENHAVFRAQPTRLGAAETDLAQLHAETDLEQLNAAWQRPDTPRDVHGR